jgi:hypothetical protein
MDVLVFATCMRGEVILSTSGEINSVLSYIFNGRLLGQFPFITGGYILFQLFVGTLLYLFQSLGITSRVGNIFPVKHSLQPQATGKPLSLITARSVSKISKKGDK